MPLGDGGLVAGDGLPEQRRLIPRTARRESYVVVGNVIAISQVCESQTCEIWKC